MLAGAAGAATVTIDGAQTYQTIDGFGVNANAQSWNNDELQPVLDALIDQGGMTLFMANLACNSNWEDANDNSDPNVMNWTYYNSVYGGPNFQRLWGMMAYLNQRGITDGLVPKFGGPAALWLGGLYLTPGYENEYAETLASALIYARNIQHLQFSVVWPVNEPDWHDAGVHMTGPAQYVTVMDDLGQQLDAHGMSDVRFSGPELAYTDTSWMAAMMGDSYLMSKLAHFGLHGYQGLSYDSTGVYDFIQQSAYPNSHFWMTEFGVWCSSCMSGTGGDDSWAYAQGTASLLINHLANGASAGVVYEAYDSQYLGYNSATGESEPAAAWSYWGLFGVDDIDAATKTYTPRKQFYTLAQISKFVRPGAQRINVSSSTTPLTLLAFYQSASGQFTLTGVNTNSSTAALSGTLASLPGIGSLELYYTDSTTNLRDSGAVPVNSGSFAATVPANCVFTLVGYTSTASAPVISQQPRSQAVLAAGTALFTVTASGAAPLSYQWRFNGTKLANGSHVSGSTSPTLSILNVQPTNAGSYSVVVTNAAGSVTSAVAVLSVIMPGSCCSPPTGLVGWWPGDGSANDIAGTNNGAIKGSATASAIGVVGSAFGFDGTDAFVQIPDAPAHKPANLTLEAWVMFSDLDSALSGTAPAGDQYIVFKQNPQTSSFEGYALEKYRLANGDVFMFTVGSASGEEVFLPSATLISTGVWYHVAAVRGPDFMQLYVNGQLETQTNVSFVQEYGTKPLYFGTSGDPGWDGKLNGSLDEVSLYNRALSAGEVAALYAAGAAGKCKAALSITAQPQNQSVAVGGNATFMVTAAGLAPLGYQWRFNGAAISRATNTSFTVTNAQSSNAGSYSAVVTNSTSSVTSAVAVLTVTVPPAITSPPASQNVVAGTNISFSVTASGTPPLSYQWQFNGAAIGGATSTSLTLLDVQPANAGNYTVVVTNSGASVTSAVAVLTVLGPPAISVQPASQSVVTGANMSFSVTASGTPPLSYQWRFNGTNLANSGQVSGVTSATLSLSNAQPTNAGSYSVVVTNAAGSVTSTVATLTVIVPGSCCSPPAGLVGWWPGDGSANDIAGTNNGILQGGATASAIGVVGSAFSFDGTNAFVQVPDAPALKPTNLTLEAWVIFSGLDSALSGTAPAGDQYIVFKHNSRTSNFEGYALEKFRLESANGDVFMFTVGSASGEEVFLPSATLVGTGIWYHVAAVRGSNFMQLYINGQLETQTNVSFAQDYGTKPLYFGTSGDTGWDGKLKGRLDEASLYNRALSASEVAALYAAGAAGKCKALSITTQPQNQSVAVGSNATFTVTAAGLAPLGYQWRFNGAAISRATNTSLTVTNAQSSNAGSYSALVTNSTSSVTSAVAVLTVTVPLAITSQPQSQTNNLGTTATFTVSATGTAPLNYQWRKGATNLAGYTGVTLTLTNVCRRDVDVYTVLVTNLGGSTLSSNALLLVRVPQRLGPPTLLSDGTCVMLSGDADGGLLSTNVLANFDLYASTNLQTWVPLTNSLSLTSGQLQIRDSGRTNLPQRFYRMVEH